MDQLMVNIKNDKVNISDEVVLIGNQKNEKIDTLELAKLLNTSSYDITTSLKRLTRIYKK